MKQTLSVTLCVVLAGIALGQAWQNGPQSDFGYTRFDGEYFTGTKKVYFMGGRIGNATTLPDIWSYNPEAGTYADEGVDMQKAVSNYDICLLQDDYDLPNGDTFGLYIVGGRYDQSPNYTDSVQVYYPRTNTARIMDTDLFPGRAGGQITVAQSSIEHSNLIYTFGGFSQTGDATSAETWLFDPMATAGSRWTQLPDMALARAYPIVASVDSFIYAFGGDTWNDPSLFAQTQSQRFNVNDTGAGWSMVADMPAANGQARAFGFDSDADHEFAGKVIVAGRGVWPSESAHCYIYDVAQDSWATFPSLAQRRRNHAGTFIPAEAGGTGVPGMWIWGGRQDSDTNCLRVSEYYVLELVGAEEKPYRGWNSAGRRKPTVMRVPDLRSFGGRVMDIHGRDVTEQKHALAPGIYFIKPAEGIETRKVVVTR